MIETASLVNDAAARHADRPALISGHQTLSYEEFARRVSDMSEGLKRSISATPGPVGLVGPSSVDYIVILFGALLAGRVICPLSNRFPKRTLEKQMSLIGCDMVLFDSSIPPDRLPSSMLNLKFDNIAPTNMETTVDTTGRLQEVLHPGTIMFTAGSTSEGKAVFHSVDAHYHSAAGSNDNIALAPDDRWLVSLPLYHVGGLAILFRCMLAGACAVIAEPGRTLAENISLQSISHLSLVPTQLLQLLDDDRFVRSIPGLKAVLLGGAAADRALVDRATHHQVPLYCSYGLTEAASQVATTAPGDRGARLYSSGRPLNHRGLKISNSGEILVSGKTMCEGYFGRGGIESVLDKEGWFATGDVGRVDEQGYLTVFGRKDSMIVSGGENIHPEELERALTALEGVREALVVGVPDKKFGSRPVAFVRYSGSDDSFDQEALLTELRQTLPGFKIPDRILPWPEEVENLSIKPDRHRLAELARRLVQPG